MIRHVSVFSLQDKEQIPAFVKKLEKVGRQCPLIVHSETGINFSVPAPGIPGPHFGDVIQIVDFACRKDLEQYPASSEHMELVAASPCMNTVWAVDYEQGS